MAASDEENIVMLDPYFDDRVNSRTYFRSYKNDDERFELGNFVMLMLESSGSKSLVAGEILHLWTEDDHEKFAEIRWCYSRSELQDHIAPPKRLPAKVLSVPKHVLRAMNMSIQTLQEDRELFLSDEVDTCPVASISFLIKVVNPNTFATALQDNDDDDDEEEPSSQTQTFSQQIEYDDDENDEGESNDEDELDLSGLDDDDSSDDIPPYIHRVYFCTRQYFGRNIKRIIDVNIDDGLHWRNAIEFSTHEYVTSAEIISIEEGASFPLQGAQNWFGGDMLTSPFASKKSKRQCKGSGAKDGPTKQQRNEVHQEPFAEAIDRLQLSSVPKKLPCRETERSKLYGLLSNAIRDNGGCNPVVYLSGMPGTGKTATVRQVATELQVESHAGHLPPFKFIELNGMRFREPEDMYTELWFSLSGKRLSPNKAAAELEKWTKLSKKKNVGVVKKAPLVILMMDELDYILTSKKDILYNLFDWPTRPGARLVVVGIANTMDLPERLGGKIKSRSTHEPINFKSYSRNEVEIIIKSRLKELTNVFEPSAITIAAAKVSAYSGDVRFALQICSRAADMRRSKIELNRERASLGHGGSVPNQVCKDDIVQVIKQFNESTQVEALHYLAPCEVFVLVAIGNEIRGVGRSNVSFESVYVKMRMIYLRMNDIEREEYGGGKGKDICITQSEALEIVERLATAQIVKLTSSRGMSFNPSHRAMQFKLPYLELSIQESFLSETLCKSHSIANTFFTPQLKFERAS